MASSGTIEGANTSEVHDSYHSVSSSIFINLNNPITLNTLVANIQSYRTRNFLLDFSDKASLVSFDLLTQSVEALLEAERPEALSTRWINIWFPNRHMSLLELLAKRYDFSPRLLALMCSDPTVPRGSQSSVQKPTHSIRQHRPASDAETELEKGFDELMELSSVASYDSVARSNLYKIINDLWHYSSIDFGRNYVCLGYNSLYGTKHAGMPAGDGLLPHCTRVWTWLVLCEDHTVISIHEDPFPFSQGELDPFQQRVLVERRRNLVNVFRSLSTVGEPTYSRAPMSLLPIRSRLGNTTEESAHQLTDMPGLLFYYLFGNWYNSYTLVTRRESRYGIELNKLRREMFDLPKLCHIDRLDTIGKELGTLRRHFGSYNRIIDRILEPQTATAASLQNSRVGSEMSQTSLDTVRPYIPERESMLGVSLSSPARVRFSRLRDLIDLYALNEVEEYIKQKDSLVAMNFQLIAIKESLDVERLTRIKLLLTKVTIIFLPVSLMTAYFSVPLVDMLYSVRDYWISFGVIFFLSWSALLVFGVFSGSVQTLNFWRVMIRVWERGLRCLRGRL